MEGALVVCQPTLELLPFQTDLIFIAIYKICLFHRLSPFLQTLGQTRPSLCGESSEKNPYVRSKCPLDMTVLLVDSSLREATLCLRNTITLLWNMISGQQCLLQSESPVFHGTNTTTSANRDHTRPSGLPKRSVGYIESVSLLKTPVTSLVCLVSPRRASFAYTKKGARVNSGTRSHPECGRLAPVAWNHMIAPRLWWHMVLLSIVA